MAMYIGKAVVLSVAGCVVLLATAADAEAWQRRRPRCVSTCRPVRRQVVYRPVRTPPQQSMANAAAFSNGPMSAAHANSMSAGMGSQSSAMSSAFSAPGQSSAFANSMSFGPNGFSGAFSSSMTIGGMSQSMSNSFNSGPMGMPMGMPYGR